MFLGPEQKNTNVFGVFGAGLKKHQCSWRWRKKMLEKIKKIFIDNKIVIIATYIIGLITHFYLYSNNLICSDALEKGQYCIAGKWEQTLGRWAIQFFDMLRGGIVSSIIIVVISLGFLVMASIYISTIFDIKSNYLKVLVSIIIVVSPQIANTFLYTYCADAYCAAMFTSVLTVYFMTIYNNGNNCKFGGGSLITHNIFDFYFSHIPSIFGCDYDINYI